MKKLGFLLFLIAVSTALYAQETLITMGEVPFQPVNGLTLLGVTFADTSGAYIDAGDGGQQHDTQDPVIEGNTAGEILTMTFLKPAYGLQFGVSLSTPYPLTPGFVVQLFGPSGNPLGTFPVNTAPVGSDFFTEGIFSSGTGVIIGKAVVTFNSDGASAFGLDNVLFPLSTYFVTSYSNANTTGAPDATLRLINDGGQSTSQTEGKPNGNLWADIYVFDDSQEMQDCCSCSVSADGLLSESVNKQLANPALELTGRAEVNRGVIKVLSSSNNDPTNALVAPGLRGWMTHIQSTSTTVSTTPPYPSTGKAPFYVSESDLGNSNLSAAELSALEQSCSYAITLGSGYGVCTCTPEDRDF